MRDTFRALITKSQDVQAHYRQYVETQKEYDDIRDTIMRAYIASWTPISLQMSINNMSGLLCLKRCLIKKVKRMRDIEMAKFVFKLPNELFEMIVLYLENGIICCHLECDIAYNPKYDQQRVMCLATGRSYILPTQCTCRGPRQRFLCAEPGRELKALDN